MITLRKTNEHHLMKSNFDLTARSRTTLVFGILWFLSASLAPAETAGGALFTPAPAPETNAASLPPGVAQRQFVTINAEAIASLEAKTTDRVGLVMSDRKRTAVFSRREAFGPGRFAWVGKIEGDPLSRVCLSVCDGAVTFDAQAFGTKYLRSCHAGNGGYWLDEVNPESLGSCGTKDDEPAKPSAASEREPTAAADKEAGRTPADGAVTQVLDGNNWIDVLGLYTVAARDAVGGVASIRSLFQARVATANSVHADSDTSVRFRLIDVQPFPSYWENDPTKDLTSYGVVNSLADELENNPVRLNVGADLIHTIIHHPQTDGIDGAAAIGWFTSASKWDAPDLTFTHELGHSMGCRHQLVADSSGTTNHAYAAFHQWSDGVVSSIKSVMWSSSAVTATSFRLGRFSNPLDTVTITRDGWGSVDKPFGDEATANNANYIYNNYLTTQRLKSPSFFVRAGAGAGQASVLAPTATYSEIYTDGWVGNAGTDLTEPIVVKFEAGNHVTLTRLFRTGIAGAITRLQKWDSALGGGSGNARLAP